MAVSVEPGTGCTTAEIAALAAAHQSRPERHIAYLGQDAASMEAEIDTVAGWRDHLFVARRAGILVGFLFGEIDPGMGRVWWWGPFAPDDAWAPVADQLYRAARGSLANGVGQEELAGHGRHTELAAFAGRHGFTAGKAGIAMTRDDTALAPAAGFELSRGGGAGRDLAALHDTAFPGAHYTGAALVDGTGGHALVRADDNGELVGYAAGQVQPDGSGYIDFLAVAPGRRRQGAGSALIAALAASLQEAGASSLHLTVREDNAAARRLYAGLGFRDALVLRPYRKGFALD